MKAVKFLIVTILSVASLELFAGWAKDEIVMDKYKDCPESCCNLKNAYSFYGKKEGKDIWLCCDVEVDEETLEYNIPKDVPVRVFNNYIQIQGFGMFKDKESLNEWLGSFYIEETDPYTGQTVLTTNYDFDKLMDLWEKVYSLNMETFANAMFEFCDNCEAYLAKQKQTGGTTEQGGGGGGGGGGGSSSREKVAEDIENIQEASEATKESVESAKETIEKKIPEVMEKLREQQLELAKYDEQRTEEARKKISEATTFFESARGKLEDAISDPEGGFEKLDGVNVDLEASIENLNESLGFINGLPGDGYLAMRNEIQNAIGVIGSAMIDIQAAKEEKNMARASNALTALKGLNDLESVRLATNHAFLMLRKAKGDAALESKHLSTLMALIDQYEILLGKVVEMQEKFRASIERYMIDMNTLGAYLGSTNAMAYFSREQDVGGIITSNDWARWGKFSAPEKLKNSPSSYTDFNVDGLLWYTILHNLQSQYYIQAMPLDGLPIVMDHFGMTSVGQDNYRGFLENWDFKDRGGIVTNWYANNISAPKNWADGSTVFCANGVYSAGCWIYDTNSSNFVNRAVQIGDTITEARLDTGAYGDGEYTLHIDISGTSTPRATVYKGEIEREDTVYDIYISLGRVSGGEIINSSHRFHGPIVVPLWL